MTFRIKLYEVVAFGHPWTVYPAASRSKARAEAYRAYSEVFRATFAQFITNCTVRRATATPAGFGHRIRVFGEPAFFVDWFGQYVRFARPNGETLQISHPHDVEWIDAPPQDKDFQG